ncbi:hypothetical protein RJ639_013031 [Escallonia herrerae]|uniref:Uncharacterized protein n=1 Tax=Escallonia herrerae TaxID=1293975 RepID=A0AA89APB8_9ASTE|nr:hypothetical protein RJ639_013031 [Escallonia herrerae]
MYSSSSTDYQKFMASQPPTAPPPPAPYGSQPVMGTPIGFSAPSQVPSQWSTGLCDCSSDCSNCCITCCCPCITFGQIAEIVGKGSTCKSNEFIDRFHVYVMSVNVSFGSSLLTSILHLSLTCLTLYDNKGLKGLFSWALIAACVVSGALYALITMVTGCGCMYSCFYRSKMRSQYMLPENPCGDCLVHCCCEACALCQEYRELKHRGFDMSLGWQENVDRQNRGVAMASVAPPVQGGMDRY